MNDDRQSIFDVAEICNCKGVKNAIIAPGSRSAPLTLAFVRHPGITCRAVVDERCAAFTAMGIAQRTGKLVVLICTSGTAALNFAPAVAEAFFQQIPLLVLTADRPPEWTAQQDGQTIFQRNLYGDNCRAYFELPVDSAHPDAAWQIRRTISDAINCATDAIPGPVQVNIPLREPLYPTAPMQYTSPRTIAATPVENHLPEQAWNEILDIWGSCQRKLIVAGLQPPPFVESLHQVKTVCEKEDMVLLADVTSNYQKLQEICHYDAILGSNSEDLYSNLRPDLLVTFGGPVVSKHLKSFLRQRPAKHHWHLQFSRKSVDSFQSLTKILPVTPDYFFWRLCHSAPAPSPESSYRKDWLRLQAIVAEKVRGFLGRSPMSEIVCMQQVLTALPAESVLHLGNSAIVRLANFVGMQATGEVAVYSNRGTCGIDGTLSTAVGAAFSTSKLTTIILGDLSFFYDRNGLWQQSLPENLRIIVFNNHGGGIFRTLAGCQDLPELESFFEVGHNRSARNTALEHGLQYFSCETIDTLRENLRSFFATDHGPCLLEVQFDKFVNADTFQEFKTMLREIS